MPTRSLFHAPPDRHPRGRPAEYSRDAPTAAMDGRYKSGEAGHQPARPSDQRLGYLFFAALSLSRLIIFTAISI